MIRSGSLEEELLNFGFSPHEGTFAAGQQANNKLVIDYVALQKSPALLDRIVGGMVGIAQHYDPQFIVGVPDGATDLAAHVAREMGVAHVALRKDEETKEVSYLGDEDRIKVLRFERGVLVEDVMNQLASTERSLRVEHLAPKIAAAIGIFGRGLSGNRRPIHKPVHTLATHHIPDMLPETSDLWQYAS